MSELDEAAVFEAQMEAHKATVTETPATQNVAEIATEVVAKVEDSATFDPSTLPPAAKTQWEVTQKRLAESEERAKRLDQENRSFRSKTPHLEAKAARLENELRARAQERALPATVREVRPGATTVAPGKVADPTGSTDFLRKLHATFGDDAAPIEEAFTNLQTQNQGLIERLAKAEARQAEIDELLEKEVNPRFREFDELREQRAHDQLESATQEVMKARESLATKYPNWQGHILHKYDDSNEITETALSDEMADWLAEQPDSIVNMLKGSAKEVDRALGLFYAEVINKAAPANSDATDQATKELETRKKNLAAQIAPRTTGVPRMDAGDLSDEDRFDAQMAEVRRHKRR